MMVTKLLRLLLIYLLQIAVVVHTLRHTHCQLSHFLFVSSHTMRIAGKKAGNERDRFVQEARFAD